jgi:hypothetical protein
VDFTLFASGDGTENTPGQATPGTDYSATNGTVTFGPGETSKAISLSVVNDALRESDELLSVSLSNVGGGAQIGAPSSASITIVDDDTPPPPGAPVITSPLATSAEPGRAFTYAISATHTPSSFAAGGLPAGLSVSTQTGVISGTPTAEGTFDVLISATNAAGTGSATLVLTIDADGSPELSGTFTDLTVRRKKNGSLLIRGLATITNSGRQTALDFVQTVYLSSDAILDPSTDLVLGSVNGVPAPFRGKKNGQLLANASIGPKPVKIPLSKRAASRFVGNYLLIAIDSGGSVTEANESNNTIVIGPLTP